MADMIPLRAEDASQFPLKTLLIGNKKWSKIRPPLYYLRCGLEINEMKEAIKATRWQLAEMDGFLDSFNDVAECVEESSLYFGKAQKLETNTVPTL
ncbi:hypothetical protein RJT34_13667 [Clitoria ternatea]|uniref:Uncharacterized protein n=1 Tax=Clitoria ternatea TaxID=43366 RepID=A0AAN9JR29_CLITE